MQPCVYQIIHPERVSVMLLGVFVCTCVVDTVHNASSRSVSRDSSRDFSYQEVAYYRLSAN